MLNVNSFFEEKIIYYCVCLGNLRKRLRKIIKKSGHAPALINVFSLVKVAFWNLIW